MTKLNPEVKAKWLAALRSGEYAQTKGYLQNDQGYCCLGVLCEIAVKDGVIQPPTLDIDSTFGARIYDGRAELPTDTVAEWAGFGFNDLKMRQLSPIVTAYSPEYDADIEVSLSEINDTWDATFEDIADLVEAQL